MKHTPFICICIALLFFFQIKTVSAKSKQKPSQVVKFLPGFQGPLPFHLETGYIGVDEGDNVELFYYFVKSSSSSSSSPVILWMTGGPGCSGLTGLFHEIGPISIDEAHDDGNLPTLFLNPYAWTEVANVIFIDLPVGAGFSYAKTPEAAHSTGIQSCQQAYQFLQKWLVEHHPELASNPLYVGGHSYTGMVVPVIVKLISDGNELGLDPRINLKGYLLGNGLTFPNEKNYKISFAHGMGLISDELYESLEQNCGGNYIDIDPYNLPCLKDVENFHKLVDDLFEKQILEIDCDDDDDDDVAVVASRTPRKGHRVLYANKQCSKPKCYAYKHKYLNPWVNDPDAQEALHVRKGSIIGQWTRCNRSLPYTNNFWNSVPYHAYLSSKGYRSLIYSGDHDMSVPFLSTQAWIRSLNYSIVDEWRQWLVQGNIAGYTRTYANNMTFATIKGGAHVAPESNPKECEAMFKRWISHQPL